MMQGGEEISNDYTQEAQSNNPFSADIPSGIAPQEAQDQGNQGNHGNNPFSADTPSSGMNPLPLMSDKKLVVPTRETHFTCKVRDPQRQGEGIRQYIAYRVIMYQGGVQCDETGVERRFSDFVWYKQQLERVFPGCVVPELPDTNSVRDRLHRFEGEFITERLTGLEFFLNHIGEHYKLHKASLTASFLSLSIDEFAAYKQNVSSGALSNDDEKSGLGGGSIGESGADEGRPRSKSETKKVGLAGWFNTTIFQMKKTFNAKKIPSQNGDDIKCQELTAYTTELAENMKGAVESLEALVKQHRQLSKDWFLFGMNTTMLGTFITKDHAQRAFGMHTNRFGNASDRIAALVGRQAETEATLFAAMLRDTYKMKDSMSAMLQRRADRDLSYQTRLNLLTEKQIKLQKVQGVPGKEDKVSKLNESIDRHTVIVDEQKAILDAVTESCFIEIEVVKRNQAADMSEMMTKFVESQIAHNRNMTKMWEATLSQMTKAQPE